MDEQEIEIKIKIRIRNAVSCSVMNSEKQEPQVNF